MQNKPKNKNEEFIFEETFVFGETQNDIEIDREEQNIDEDFFVEDYINFD